MNLESFEVTYDSWYNVQENSKDTYWYIQMK